MEEDQCAETEVNTLRQISTTKAPALTGMYNGAKYIRDQYDYKHCGENRGELLYVCVDLR